MPTEPNILGNAASVFARLGPCPGCGRRMFDHDESCPHCGYCLSPSEIGELKEYVNAYRRKGRWLVLILMPILILVFWAIARGSAQ